MELSPYLFFNGNCKEAFTFYAKVLGGELMVMTQGETPMADEAPPEARDLVMHARLDFGDRELLGSDNEPGATEKPDAFSLSLTYPEAAQAERVFQALAEGGKVTMPMQETFWAVRYGMLIDRFGMPWMVNCNRPMQG